MPIPEHPVEPSGRTRSLPPVGHGSIPLTTQPEPMWRPGYRWGTGGASMPTLTRQSSSTMRIAAATDVQPTSRDLYAARLADLLESAPPRLNVRLASTSRYSDRS